MNGLLGVICQTMRSLATVVRARRERLFGVPNRGTRAIREQGPVRYPGETNMLAEASTRVRGRLFYSYFGDAAFEFGFVDDLDA